MRMIANHFFCQDSKLHQYVSFFNTYMKDRAIDIPKSSTSLTTPQLTTPTNPPLHLLWYINALGYTYPSTKASSQVYNIDFLTPGDQLTLPKHLGRALRSAL